jgi:squalene synthase HpnC
LGRAGGENFPVALRILPSEVRRDLLDVYGFARLTDQLGDAYPGDRLAALDWLERDLQGALAGERAHPLVASVALALSRHHMNPAPLFDLIEANRQDQSVTSYATFEDLLAYCRLSANPVGRLVLGIFEQADLTQVGWSDAICTGLQLAEHWGDVAEDAVAGRVYLPEEDLDRFGVDSKELHAGPPARAAVRALMAFEVDRARRYLREGTPLVSSLRGWARAAVCGFAGGGFAALDAIAAARFDPLGGAPRRSTLRIAAASAGLWSRPATKGRRA